MQHIGLDEIRLKVLFWVVYEAKMTHFMIKPLRGEDLPFLPFRIWWQINIEDF